jgi:hypothetical protein
MSRKPKPPKPEKPRRTKHVHSYQFAGSFPVPGKPDHKLYRCDCGDEYFVEGNG